MMTKSGWLTLNKTEQRGLKTLLKHAQHDLSFGVDGSYGDGENLNTKEVRSGELGISVLEFIIDTYCYKDVI